MIIHSDRQIGCCRISLATLRYKPDYNAPILTQILFGEQVALIRKKSKHWYKVKCLWDNVEGWIDPKQFEFSINKENTCLTFALEHFHPVTNDLQSIPILLGSNLLNCDGINVKMPFGKFQYNGQIVNLEQSRNSRKLLINIVRRFLHTPFFQGGRSIFGTDSSGFIQIAYKLIGISLPRYTHDMVSQGVDVGFVHEARPGDIAFFENKEKQISHAGIVLEDQKIIHVHGMVRIDRLDQQGIYVKRRRSYTYNLRTIRSIIN